MNTFINVIESHGDTYLINSSLSERVHIRLMNFPREQLLVAALHLLAFAIASGLWLGGASPLVVIQTTGLLESGDSLRGTAARMGAPIPILITGRGYSKMKEARLKPSDLRERDLLTRGDVDSVALLTEPTLEVWGVPFERCEGEDDPSTVLARTIDSARSTERPTAVVMARGLT